MLPKFWHTTGKTVLITLFCIAAESGMARALDQLPTAIDPNATSLDDAIAIAADTAIGQLMVTGSDPICLVFDANHRAGGIDFSAPDSDAEAEIKLPDFGGGNPFYIPPPSPPTTDADVHFAPPIAQVLSAQYPDPKVKFAPDCASYSRHVVVSPPEALEDHECNGTNCGRVCTVLPCRPLFESSATGSRELPRRFQIPIKIHSRSYRESFRILVDITDGQLSEIRQTSRWITHID